MTHKELIDKLRGINSLRKLAEKISSNNFEDGVLYSSQLSGASKSLLIQNIFPKQKQIVVLFPTVKDVEEFLVELNEIGLSDSTIAVTEFSSENIQEKLTDLASKEKFILISNYNLLNLELPSKHQIQQKTTKIQIGGELTYNDLIEYLNLLNYTKDKFVEVPGDYSLRGSIIDFWSYSEKNPIRLEFDGDFIESIRYFNPESQRSTVRAEVATLAGALNSNESDSSTATIYEYLNDPLFIVSSYDMDNLSSEKINPFLEEKENIANQTKSKSEKEDDDFSEEEMKEVIIKETSKINKSDFFKIEKTRWLVEEEIATNNNRTDLGLIEAPTINSNFEILFNTLRNFADQSFDIIITSENELQTMRLKDLLSEFKSELAKLIESGKVKVETLAIKKGFLSKEEKLLVLTDYQIFNKPYRTKVSTSRKYKKSKSKAFASIKRGDFVVHEDYGIGRYAGLETIKIGETEQESMKILYNEGGVVYVNLNYLTLVKKYSSNESITPALSTLGTTDWSNTKTKTKKKIKEAARELIELYAKRKATKGFSYNHDTVWQKELEASFFYEDTADQERVTEEVKQDMEAENPMDRLICGDVGFGKTEVAVRAAFKAVQDSKQTAVLVPTTILSEQHFNTFKDRLTQFPVRVSVLSRFQTKKEQNEIVKNLSDGNLDVVIGTHRLLSKDIKFKDIGLLIIDEEHRFGVKAKEKLRSLKVNVDTLALTATPIPRTLNLSLLGARDLSIIGTPPPNRQPIYTTVSTFDIFKIKEWVLNEVRRNGQVYFVHDRVQSIEKLSNYIRKYIPEVKIAVAHGQMKPSQLENVIHGFLNKKYDILLSTKIIESGIDIPNVNTIIVNRADRFGLAELHQLRGRVGRSDRQAYAYFIVPSLHGISKKALKRLQAIEEFTDIGAGFNISMRDLEIRGAGNLLGVEQTGFINDVGFDLYVKLINEAVEELKYQEFKEVFKTLPKPKDRTEPTIDTFFEIGIPQTYMPEQSDRLNFYSALYSINSMEELQELRDEIIDRFGTLPELVNRLIAAATLKYYASHALFERIIIQRKNIFIILPRGEKEDYYKYKFVELMRFVIDNYKDKIKFNQQKEIMRLIIPNTFNTPENILSFLINWCKEVMNLFNRHEEKVTENIDAAQT